MKLILTDDNDAAPRAEIALTNAGAARIVKPGPSLTSLLRALYEAEAAVIERIESSLKAEPKAESPHCPNCGALAGIGVPANSIPSATANP